MAFNEVIVQRMSHCSNVYDKADCVHRFLQGLNTEVKCKALQHNAEHPGIILDQLANLA